jgi:hypothetical protein
MSPHVKPPGQASGKGGSGRRRKPPRDLIDFYRRWPEFREIAVALARRGDLSTEQRETLSWLILLADRVGEQDIEPRERGKDEKGAQA